jgi:hypothetical protein
MLASYIEAFAASSRGKAPMTVRSITSANSEIAFAIGQICVFHCDSISILSSQNRGSTHYSSKKRAKGLLKKEPKSRPL